MSRVHNSRNRAARTEPVRGAVLVESCTAVILLLLFLTCLLDIGRMVHHYVVLTQAANEAARLASRTPGLEPGTYPQITADGSSINTTAHASIHARAQVILNSYQHNLRLSSIEPSTQYLRYNSSSSSGTGMVKVEVRAQYLGFFPWFRRVNLRVNQTAEYLGKEN